MLRLESKQTEICNDSAHERHTDGEGFWFLGVLAGSWIAAIAIGWVVWHLAPL